MFQPIENHSLTKLSRLLLKKGISFCLYRFPNEKEYHLAIEKELLSSYDISNTIKDPIGFIIAPFIQNEESSDVLLQRISLKDANDRFLEFIERLEDRPIDGHTLPVAITKDDYLKKIGQYLDDIRSGKLSKAILSRVILVDKPKALDVFNFYTTLSSTYPETFASLFYVPGMGIWTGASPELLLEKKNTTYQTMALAGTQDKKTAGQYSWRKKEEAEHHLVQQHIEEIFLKNNCSLVYSNGPYTIETGKVAHLKTDYTFEEKTLNNQETIIRQLHPTPAIGGLPVAEAIDCIRNYEGYNRNYYSGYFGETNSHDYTRLYINLRCMQIGKDKIAIYVGSGISIDSNPEEEWAETNQKSLTLLEIIEENDPAKCPMKMKLSNKKSIQEIVLTLAALGLKHVVIAPGSRNGPLTISFNQHPGFHCTSIRDERSAGFFALGKAIELKEPVAILCSSGSASLNFAPAIVEAFYLRVPLIVITADRPAEWIGQMDGQTMNQTNVYANYIRKSYTLNGDAVEGNDLWHNAHCVNEGFAIATRLDPGPVHFNVPMKEPLFFTEEPASFTPRLISFPTQEFTTDIKNIEEYKNAFTKAKKVMVLVGQHSVDEDLNVIVARLAENSNTIVLTESTSNIHSPEFISSIDRCIMPMRAEEIQEFMPDLLITFGGAIVSKKIKELLRKNKPAEHWNIHPHDSLVNTYQALTKALPLEPISFLTQLVTDLPLVTKRGYKEKWLNRSAEIQQKHDSFFREIEYSDLFVFEKIYKNIPPEFSLHFANSSPVRYSQLFNNSGIQSIHSNRGTSGIDGCTSTAMGAASANPKQQYLLITGDVAFFYDNNAFWNDRIPKNLRIILINNAGGGIFRIIKGPRSTEELEEFFETKHSTSAKKLVEFYEWNYLSAHDEESLLSGLESFFSATEGKIVLEIFTPNEVNSHILSRYFKYLTL